MIWQEGDGHLHAQVTRDQVKRYSLLPDALTGYVGIALSKPGCQRVLSDSRSASLKLSSMDIIQFPKLAQASPLTANLRRAALASPGTSGYEL